MGNAHLWPFLHGEVLGMILLRDLKGAMRLVCACFNLHQLRFKLINASCVEVVALLYKTCVFLRLVAKMSDRFLEQRNILGEIRKECK
jgi:predicted membrane-bound spermidine synthase